MFDVVVHVQVKEPEHRVGQHGPRRGPVIKDVLGQPEVLRATLVREDMQAFRRKLPFLNDADRFSVR